jgi:hypothetical protein
MPSQSITVISSRRDSDRNDDVVDLAYIFWLARGVRGGSPAEDVSTALRKFRAKTSAGLFLVPKRNPTTFIRSGGGLRNETL